MRCLPRVVLLALCGVPFAAASATCDDGALEPTGACSPDSDAASLLAHSRDALRLSSSPAAAPAAAAAAATPPSAGGGEPRGPASAEAAGEPLPRRAGPPSGAGAAAEPGAVARRTPTEDRPAVVEEAALPRRTLTEIYLQMVRDVPLAVSNLRIILSIALVILVVFFFFYGRGWTWFSSSQSVLCCAVCGMLIFGSTNVLAKDALVVHDFYNPFMWNCVTMIGQTMCMPLYWLSKAIANDPAPANGNAKGMAPFSVLVQVTLIDLTALSLINTTYNVLPGSLIQMLRGCKVAFTCLLSKAMLGSSFDSPKLIGIAMNFAGLLFIIVSSRNSMWGDADDSKSKVVAALCVGVASQLVGSFQFIYEKKVMESYDVPPLLLAGYEGIIGTPVALTVLFGTNIAGLEDSVTAMSQIAHSHVICSLMVLFLFAVATFNLAGISVAKHGSPVLRALLEIMRTACIWTLEVARGWMGFSLMELSAYLLTSVGTLIYGKLIPIPCIPAEK